jgi:hypothetical protein
MRPNLIILAEDVVVQGIHIKVRGMWGSRESSFLFGAAIAFCAECIMGSRNFRLTHSAPLHCLTRNYSANELKVWPRHPASSGT